MLPRAMLAPHSDLHIEIDKESTDETLRFHNQSQLIGEATGATHSGNTETKPRNLKDMHQWRERRAQEAENYQIGCCTSSNPRHCWLVVT